MKPEGEGASSERDTGRMQGQENRGRASISSTMSDMKGNKPAAVVLVGVQMGTSSAGSSKSPNSSITINIC